MKSYIQCMLLSCAALVLATVAGCGGGDTLLAGGVGSGGSGVVDVSVAEGVITGFGSVIVDGTEYDDSNATVQSDDATGSLRNTELKLGQRVRLQLDSAGKVQNVSVMAQLSGPVTAAPDSSGTLRVLGQPVRLSGSASDGGRGMAAQVAGFSLAPQVGDEVEVHGSWVFDAMASRYVLLANRLEKLTNPAASVQLSGVVTRVSGATLGLNSAVGFSVSGASVPGSVVVGSLVRVWASRTAWTDYSAASNLALKVSRVVNASALSSASIGDQKLRLAGPVTNFDAATRTVEIAGVRVAVPASIALDNAALAAGQIISVEVQRKGGAVVVESAVSRGAVGTASDLGQTLKAKAIVSGVLWSSSPVQFTLRGVKWSASQAAISSACRSAKTTDDVLVTAQGKAQAGSETVVATEVQCAPTLNSVLANAATTTERSGKVANLNLKAQTFTLQSSKTDITVTWDSQTYFDDDFAKHPESLSGQNVEIEGVATTSGLRARKVKRAD
jgi:hypothetical protein